MFAGYGPTPTSEGEVVAPMIDALPKHVCSRTLDAAPWGGHAAAVHPGEARETVRRLKDGGGRAAFPAGGRPPGLELLSSEVLGPLVATDHAVSPQ